MKPYSDLEIPGFWIRVYTGIGPRDLADDNVDVEVTHSSGVRYVGTLATLRNVQRFLEKEGSEEDEPGCGLYFWCSDLVIVQDLRSETIVKTVKALIEAEELGSAFQTIGQGEDFAAD
ncbi:MAG: hypothetical protein AAF725_08670 [Acidobacteriota bacterium]